MTDLPFDVGILGTGYAVPPWIRTNQDPVFDWLRANDPAHSDLFKGYDLRHYLPPGKCLQPYMVEACVRALKQARLTPDHMDALLGYFSVARWQAPNTLWETFRDLNMRGDAWGLPVQGDFTNFMSSVVFARNAIALRQWRYALVVCGCDWTRHVDYHDAIAIAVGDGCGAAVIGPIQDRATQWRYVDSMTLSATQWYGVMMMAGIKVVQNEAGCKNEYGAPINDLYTRPLFELTPEADDVFAEWAETEPAYLVQRLLDKHGVKNIETTMIAHQASTVLIDSWKKILRPIHYLDTIAIFGNVTLASVPVTLAYYHDQIQTDWLVLMGLGLGNHSTALLFRRGDAKEGSGP